MFFRLDRRALPAPDAASPGPEATAAEWEGTHDLETDIRTVVILHEMKSWRRGEWTHDESDESMTHPWIRREPVLISLF